MSVGFTAEEKNSVTKFLSLSLSGGTLKQYKGPWNKWLAYISGVKGPGEGDCFLDLLTDCDKVIRVILFIKHLYELGLRKGQVYRQMSAIKTTFELNQRSSVVFDDPLVARAKKSTVGTNEEIEMANRHKLKNPTIAMAGDMVMKCRDLAWVEYAWDAEGMMKKGAWLVIGLSFNFGSRVGQLTLAPKTKFGDPASSDHCLKCADMKFYVKEAGVPGGVVPLTGGEEVREFLVTGSVLGKITRKKGVNNLDKNVARVQFTELSFLTSKTSRQAVITNIVDVKKVGRTSDEESILLNDLCYWMVYAKPKLGDELLTRYWPKKSGKKPDNRKVVSANIVNLVIKILARWYGLPEAMFSSRSLRSGMASQTKAVGMSDEQRNRIGGWALNSKVPKTHYIHNVATGGVFAKEQPGEWTVNEVRHLVTRRSML